MGRIRTGPASFKGRRSPTRRRSQCVLVKICSSTWDLASERRCWINRRYIQDICGHIALRAIYKMERIYMKTSVRRYKTIALSLLKKDELEE